jgi:hypothetical protein
MRTRILSFGLILLLIGVYLIFGGADLIKTLSTSTTTTSVQTETQKQVLLTVEGNSYTYLSTSPSIHNLQVSYKATGEISIYIMNNSEFEDWKNGKPTTVQIYVFSAKDGDFMFTPEHGGTYYIVFDNRGSNSVKSVIVNISNEKVVTTTIPAIEYLPQFLIIIGIILTGFGLAGKRKRKSPQKDRGTLERMARSLDIDPEGLTNNELLEEIRRKAASQE